MGPRFEGQCFELYRLLSEKEVDIQKCFLLIVIQQNQSVDNIFI